MSLLLVALIAIVLAGVTSTVAWNRSRDERNRREARIAALAAAIHDEPLDGPAPAGSAGDPFTTGDMFTTRPHAGAGFRFATVAAVGLLVCGGMVALAVVSSSASGEATVPRESSATAATESPQTSAIEPLELVALGHDRDGDRLTVRAVVRNPASGMALDRSPRLCSYTTTMAASWAADAPPSTRQCWGLAAKRRSPSRFPRQARSAGTA
jgi:hypothetical protein